MKKAKLFPLSKSYYAWITKIRLTESVDFCEKLPKTHPTSLELLRESSEKLCEEMNDTKYSSRATYWRNLFENFSGEDRPRIDEGKRINALLALLGKALVNKKKINIDTLPPDKRIIQKMKEFHKELIQIRKVKNPSFTYKRIKQSFSEAEANALHDALGIPVEDSEKPEIRQRLRYKLACWVVGGASIISPVHVMRSLSILPAFVWEYFMAFLYFIIEKAFGKKEVDEVASAV